MINIIYLYYYILLLLLTDAFGGISLYLIFYKEKQDKTIFIKLFLIFVFAFFISGGGAYFRQLIK